MLVSRTGMVQPDHERRCPPDDSCENVGDAFRVCRLHPSARRVVNQLAGGGICVSDRPRHSKWIPQ